MQNPNDLYHDVAKHKSRRQFLQDSMLGLGGLTLSMLMGSDASLSGEDADGEESSVGRLQEPHFAPQAKHVIFLHMAGAPSQLELFDYKPKLAELDGKPTPDSLLNGKEFAFIQGTPKLLGPKAEFDRYGDSGTWVSNRLPHFQEIVDDVTFLKAMHTDEFNHAPAQLMMYTGSPRPGRPSMGSWATYGLGSENENLPSFVVLLSGKNKPSAGKNTWGSGFMPSVYEGVQCRSKGDPILYVDNPDGLPRSVRKQQQEVIERLNQKNAEKFGDQQTLSRIEQYELAYKMQMSVPEVMNIAEEPEEVHEMYGTEPGKKSFANNCLLARRLVERGVRFVNLFDWGWDSHGTSGQTGLKEGFVKRCKNVDKPMTALVKDLKQRGLLDETLIVWGGEFGRTPMLENRNGVSNSFIGRDHLNSAFTMWMAGGGVKKGKVHGKTDELGYKGIDGQVHVHDLQATILNQLGFDHKKLTYRHQGRDFRLTDVHGHVVDDILEKNPNPSMT